MKKTKKSPKKTNTSLPKSRKKLFIVAAVLISALLAGTVIAVKKNNSIDAGAYTWQPIAQAQAPGGNFVTFMVCKDRYNAQGSRGYIKNPTGTDLRYTIGPLSGTVRRNSNSGAMYFYKTLPSPLAIRGAGVGIYDYNMGADINTYC